MSTPTTVLPRRRIKYTEQPFPSPNAVHSSPSVTLATRSGPPVAPAASSSPPANPVTRRSSPRKLPTPVEVSRRTGGSPSRPFFYQHDSARSVHPHTCDSMDCAMVKAMNTIEILEHICTFLAPIDVLQLQMVNKKWRSLVVHSPQLSPHLFILVSSSVLLCPSWIDFRMHPLFTLASVYTYPPFIFTRTYWVFGLVSHTALPPASPASGLFPIPQIPVLLPVAFFFICNCL